MLFQARKEVFLKQFLNRNLAFIFLWFLSEHAYVVWLLWGSNNLHSFLNIMRLVIGKIKILGIHLCHVVLINSQKAKLI